MVHWHETMSDSAAEHAHWVRSRPPRPGQSWEGTGTFDGSCEMREMFQAKAPEALEVLTRCLQSDDDRIAMMAAQAILTAAIASRRNRSTPMSLRMAVWFAITAKCLRRLTHGGLAGVA